MPYHRRNKKRHRNKSSPQIASSPKKYRQEIGCEVDNEDITELTTSESESESESSAVSTMDPRETVKNSESVATSVSEQGVGMSNNFQNSTPQQFMNVPPQFAGGSGAMMDPNMMQNATPMSPMAFNPQQMLNFSQPMSQSQQHFSQIPHYPGMSDDDVMRLAIQTKMILTDEIQRLVEERVALEVEPIRRELDSVKVTLSQLQTELKLTTVRNDDLEQYSRRSCLRVSGMAENKDENVTNIVLDLANRVGADIRPEDIDRTHRVGKPRESNVADNSSEHAATDISDEPRVQHRSREIIIKFSNYSARLKLLKGRATLREENAKIYINEDLTMKRKSLAYECRKLAKTKCISKTWVYNGNVFVQDKSGNKVRITGLQDLDTFKPDNDNGTGQ